MQSEITAALGPSTPSSSTDSYGCSHRPSCWQVGSLTSHPTSPISCLHDHPPAAAPVLVSNHQHTAPALHPSTLSSTAALSCTVAHAFSQQQPCTIFHMTLANTGAAPEAGPCTSATRITRAQSSSSAVVPGKHQSCASQANPSLPY